MATTQPKATAACPDPQYKEVRGLARGLSLLRSLNQMPGGMCSTSELARASGIHRTTTKRLLETLRQEGYVALGERDGQYRLSRLARVLGDGYQERAWVSQVAIPQLQAQATQLLWPCNLATFEAGWMVLLASTRKQSPMAHNHALLGERLPVLKTALGRAYLAACSEERLAAVLTDLRYRQKECDVDESDLQTVLETIAETRTRGYAVSADVQNARFSSVAVPVQCDETLLGSLNLVFTKNTIDNEAITQAYLPKLIALARDIGETSISWIDR
ncbi:helix-turn-helix domain-containing protein [Comamonas sp. Y33R10-2]|uniref:IclR family transcriptional regulator domain-containing protein n=1 Tax=Comamonas sp. Y33R10-2 TaxID=2853257 RepID=UPI001C5C9093|nr:IclR family transcriptional regulator C-terminal domain-containing protein [Comamonas sp. Y33R10-2]QXZ10560.1 helix-turn-helix domain-containing protein [Comamonas sp. Y33R10-2]